MSNLFFSLSPGACDLARNSKNFLESEPTGEGDFPLFSMRSPGTCAVARELPLLQRLELGGSPPTLNKHER